MSNTKYTDGVVLLRQRVWALLTYPDGSEFCFETTLCPEILNSLGVVLEEQMLVRLDKKYYIGGQMVYKQFPFEGAKVTLYDSLTYTNESSYALHQFL